jgi:hypothetical protein
MRLVQAWNQASPASCEVRAQCVNRAERLSGRHQRACRSCLAWRAFPIAADGGSVGNDPNQSLRIVRSRRSGAGGGDGCAPRAVRPLPGRVDPQLVVPGNSRQRTHHKASRAMPSVTSAAASNAKSSGVQDRKRRRWFIERRARHPFNPVGRSSPDASRRPTFSQRARCGCRLSVT